MIDARHTHVTAAVKQEISLKRRSPASTSSRAVAKLGTSAGSLTEATCGLGLDLGLGPSLDLNLDLGLGLNRGRGLGLDLHLSPGVGLNLGHVNVAVIDVKIDLALAHAIDETAGSLTIET